MKEMLEGRGRDGNGVIPFTWAPQIAYLRRLERRITVLEEVNQAVMKWLEEDGRRLSMKRINGKLVLVREEFKAVRLMGDESHA